MNYTFEASTGNLLKRINAMNGVTETFSYDNLDRLTTDITYATNGNIQSKTGIGAYSYNTNRPHAVDYITNAQGVRPPALPDITYTAFNKAESITRGDTSLSFTYGVDFERVQSVLQRGTQIITTRYISPNYEEEITATGVSKRHYLHTPSGLSAIIVQTTTATQTYYVHTDHLGSIQALTNESGTLVQRYSYDAWGKRTLITDNTGTGKPLFSRGFTGHEHLDDFSLINMNGRMYDPLTSSFLSPDPFVQSPDFTQSYNRYSYCWNNPLKYIDPSGYTTQMSLGKAFFQLYYESTYGGTWESNGDASSGNTTVFTNPGQAMQGAVDYNNFHDSWENTKL